ncbi:MAG TPA: MarR family winged helix-turn-helix transcriptional regulator [Trebonia sp.]|nr:MarR family winged helix-turn-helix transcriptional regulator [Trebonia sp.]
MGLDGLNDHPEQGRLADPDAVEAALAACQRIATVAMGTLGSAGAGTTVADCRALVELAAGGPQRLVDLAAAMGVAAPTAARTCDRLERKGLLVRKRRPCGDRRTVLISVTDAGRRVADEAIGRRRSLIACILGGLPAPRQQAVTEALRAFADAAGEIPGWQRLAGAPGKIPGQRPHVPGEPGARAGRARAVAEERR